MLTCPSPDRLCLAVAELSPEYPAPGDEEVRDPLTDTDADGRPVFDRDPVPDVKSATVVTSLTRSGRHAPALDIDLPAALTATTEGLTLWVDGLTLRGWRRAAAALAAAELGRCPRFPLWAPTRAARLARYAAARPLAIDESTRTAVLRALGPTLDCSFAQAVELATSTARPVGTPDIPPVTDGPPLRDPWPLPLSVPAMLLPSTRNHHLYLEVELDWADYRQLLERLGKAGLLEVGYVRFSVTRTATDLRLPWIHKTPEQLAAADAAKAAKAANAAAVLPRARTRRPARAAHVATPAPF